MHSIDAIISFWKPLGLKILQYACASELDVKDGIETN